MFRLTPSTGSLVYVLEGTVVRIGNPACEGFTPLSTCTNPMNPAIDWDGTRYGIVYYDNSVSFQSIHFTQMDQARAMSVPGGSFIYVYGDSPAYRPDIAWNGDSYGVVNDESSLYGLFYTRLWCTYQVPVTACSQIPASDEQNVDHGIGKRRRDVAVSRPYGGSTASRSMSVSAVDRG